MKEKQLISNISIKSLIFFIRNNSDFYFLIDLTESDYSAGTDSKTTASSKTTIEMYQGSNSERYHKGVNETSLSEEDDENKSQDAYSGHTDYEMVV